MVLWARTPRASSLPTEPVEYPIGSYVRTEKGYFYIHEVGKRMRIISERVLGSWSPHRIITTSEAAVAKYRITSKMGFRNGSLIWNLSDGKMYLIEKGKRRHVTSPDALERIGARRESALIVSLNEIEMHSEGEPLN